MIMSYLLTGDTKERACTRLGNHECLHSKYLLSTKENSLKPTGNLHRKESILVKIQRHISLNTGLRIDKIFHMNY